MPRRNLRRCVKPWKGAYASLRAKAAYSGARAEVPRRFSGATLKFEKMQNFVLQILYFLQFPRSSPGLQGRPPRILARQNMHTQTGLPPELPSSGLRGVKRVPPTPVLGEHIAKQKNNSLDSQVAAFLSHCCCVLGYSAWRKGDPGRFIWVSCCTNQTPQKQNVFPVGFRLCRPSQKGSPPKKTRYNRRRATQFFYFGLGPPRDGSPRPSARSSPERRYIASAECPGEFCSCFFPVRWARRQLGPRVDGPKKGYTKPWVL